VEDQLDAVERGVDSRTDQPVRVGNQAHDHVSSSHSCLADSADSCAPFQQGINDEKVRHRQHR
jgi:hypothetical protein